MGRKQGLSVLFTVAIETLVVATLIAIPLVAPEVLPLPGDAIAAFAATPPPPPSPPPAPTPSRPSPAAVNPDVAPIEAPVTIPPETPVTSSAALAAVPGGFETGGAGVPDGVPGGFGEAIVPPPPPPALKVPTRVGGRIQPPQKVKDVRPVYPPIAQAARVEGDVILEAVIDEQGRVTSVRVLRGHDLLNAAAIDAVRQWEFTPTRLNEEPTAVIMAVTVRFRLN